MAPAETVIAMSDEEFERQTLDLIAREFGLSGLTRFIRAYRSGRGDYTAERHQWADKLTVDDIWKQMEAEGLIAK